MKLVFVSCVATIALIAIDSSRGQAPTTMPAVAGEKTVTPSGLTIITTQKSQGAKVGDIALVLYTGRLTDGTVFDSSAKRDNAPVRVQLGSNAVIKGWEEGLLGMQVGEKRKLIVPPELAYAEKGRGEAIPPNATLEFDIELVGLTRPPPEQEQRR